AMGDVSNNRAAIPSRAPDPQRGQVEDWSRQELATPSKPRNAQQGSLTAPCQAQVSRTPHRGGQGFAISPFLVEVTAPMREGWRVHRNAVVATTSRRVPRRSGVVN